MERIGMVRGDRFGLPALPPGHPLRAHVVYRLTPARHTLRHAGAGGPYG